MATIVNTPSTSDSGTSMGLIVAILLIAFFGIIFLVYGLPMLRQGVSSTQITVPVPDQINVNVQQPQSQPAQ